ELSKIRSDQGKWNEAISLLDETLLLAIEENDSLMQARALMGKGLNQEKLSSYESSLQFHYAALAIYEALGDQFRIGIVRSNIGMTLLQLNRNKEALSEFQEAYRISEVEKDTEGIMVNTLNMGVVYQRLAQYDQATEAFQKSLVIAKAMGSWYDIALLTANLGTTAHDQKKYDEARILLERACFLKDSLGYEHDLPHTLNSLAEAYLALGLYDLALTKANEAARLATQYQKPDQLSESHQILSDVYAAKKNYPLAYDHLVRYKQLSDSVFTAESDKAISNLRIQYETTLKENKIVELNALNKRVKTTQLIYLGAACLILITGCSLIYALYIRRTRDRKILAKEMELHHLQNQFFANISHEFRTPLTLILGPLHNLRRQLKGSAEDGVLRLIQKNAERLLLLINQILDLTKFDMKVLELKKEEVNFTRMARGVCSSFDSLAQSRDIHFSYLIPDTLFVQADQRRMEIVLMNLISNAFKFTPDHGSIAVQSMINEKDKTLQITVSDSGAGIASENIPKIFDRYYHDDREAHSDFEGAGIGLALSKQIVDMHGGKISVESKIKEGSSFTITLPTISATEMSVEEVMEEKDFVDDFPATSRVEVQETLAPINGEKPIILLVEDRKDMRDYILSLLQPHYQVEEAPNASVGWSKAIEMIPDIVISDVMMPGKSGLEFCAELKADRRTSHIPVLLLTAMSSPEDRISGLETEADVYLTKPFIPQELELILHNLVLSRKKIRTFYTTNQRIEPSLMAANSIDQQFLEEFIALLQSHYAEESFSVEQLADLLNLSRSQLHRKLIALTGQ
ncbi:MAG TPA: tetratricopeptide repeat protein, partial [Saprospiraceae bacterium]|nr:tetratricopeptide repeat protein [Saprospiraceae bacterium]